jgi:hypothetical protein
MPLATWPFGRTGDILCRYLTCYSAVVVALDSWMLHFLKTQINLNCN